MQVFVRVLQWIYYFVHCAGLLAVILENVLGITWSQGGVEPPIRTFLRVVEACIPEFHWSVDVLHLTDYLQPHTRVRVFLRGCRKVFCTRVPPALKPFGSRTLRECLGAYPHTPRSHYSQNQQINLLVYEANIKDMVKDGTLSLDDVVIVAADRAEGLTYRQQMTVNVCPTLTCHNTYLTVLSVKDVVLDTPVAQREFFRKLHDCERLGLQGLPPWLIRSLPPGSILIDSRMFYSTLG
jgi:hypothetical protein